MEILVASVLIVLVVSAFCSLSEAAIYAVRKPYIRQLVDSGSVAGTQLARFKDNMELPISAILIVNTAANTAGAAIAGAQARSLFGESSLIWFSAFFTLAVLFFAEIMPKIVGIVHNGPVARALALPWAAIIAILSPVIWCIERITRYLKPSEPALSAPEEEVLHFAAMSAEEGSILPQEAVLVRNVLKLDEIKASDILTPRSVVFKLRSDMTVREVAEEVKEWTYTRIPVVSADDAENWIGVVFARDILQCLGRDNFDVTLETLCQPIYFVPEQTRAHLLLKEFLKRRSHLFGVVDEYGDIQGVVTLEDVMETLLGEEIVDEADTAVDLQAVAKLGYEQRIGKDRSQLTKPRNQSCQMMQVIPRRRTIDCLVTSIPIGQVHSRGRGYCHDAPV